MSGGPGGGNLWQPLPLRAKCAGKRWEEGKTDCSAERYRCVTLKPVATVFARQPGKVSSVHLQPGRQ